MTEKELWEEDDFSHKRRVFELYQAEKLFQKLKKGSKTCQNTARLSSRTTKTKLRA